MLPTPHIAFAFAALAKAYSLLGLSATATKVEIKAAYYSLAKLTHPDNNPSPHAASRFHAITQAYQLLLAKHTPQQQTYTPPHEEKDRTASSGSRKYSDPFEEEMFQAYQQFKRQNHFKGNNFRHFQEFFTAYYHKSQAKSPQEQYSDYEQQEEEEEEETVIQHKKAANFKRLEINIEIQVSHVEASKGVQKSILLERRIICTSCKGKPTFRLVKCSKCSGSGYYGRKDQYGFCRSCGGNKTVKKSNCETCHGKGQIDRPAEELIFIKPGTANNEELVVLGKGHQHPKKGFFGNLNIKIRIIGSQSQETNQFRKEGYNTYAKVRISLFQAVLGTRLTYSTVWGERNITLQGGCQNGDLIKRSGEGLKKQSKKENGDHFMTLQVQIPLNISEQESKIYEQLKEIMERKGKKQSS